MRGSAFRASNWAHYARVSELPPADQRSDPSICCSVLKQAPVQPQRLLEAGLKVQIGVASANEYIRFSSWVGVPGDLGPLFVGVPVRHEPGNCHPFRGPPGPTVSSYTEESQGDRDITGELARG